MTDFIIESTGETEVTPYKAQFWKLSVDYVEGVGVVLIGPNKVIIKYGARICFEVTNNIAEYEAC